MIIYNNDITIWIEYTNKQNVYNQNKILEGIIYCKLNLTILVKIIFLKKN